MASPLAQENELAHILDEQTTNSSSFMKYCRKLGNTVINTANAAGNTWRESSTVTKACIIGTTTALAAPLAILPVLGVVGFTSAGVAAGSIAASMQTAATVSGSVFALCQSAAATGVLATSTTLGVGLAAGAAAGGVTAAVCRENSDGPDNPQDETEEKIEETIEEKTEEKTEEKIEEKAEEKAEEKTEKKTEEKAEEKTEEAQIDNVLLTVPIEELARVENSVQIA